MDSGNSRTVKFKLMPDGHIRGIQAQGKDAASASEWMIYQTGGCAPTLSATHPTKLMIADEAVCGSLVWKATKKRFVIAKNRSVQGKLIRRRYRNDIGVPFALTKGYSLHLDGISGAITSFTTDNNIMELKQQQNMENMTYHEHPTKEQLIEYFSPRIRIRKMAPREAFRLMDVEDSDIDKIMNAEETVTLKDGTTRTKKAVSKTARYKLAGNSIVVSCLYHIFRTMFIPNQPENNVPKQMTLF